MELLSLFKVRLEKRNVIAVIHIIIYLRIALERMIKIMMIEEDIRKELKDIVQTPEEGEVTPEIEIMKDEIESQGKEIETIEEDIEVEVDHIEKEVIQEIETIEEEIEIETTEEEIDQEIDQRIETIEVSQEIGVKRKGRKVRREALMRRTSIRISILIEN